MASVSQKTVVATYQVLCPVLGIFDPTKSSNSRSSLQEIKKKCNTNEQEYNAEMAYKKVTKSSHVEMESNKIKSC